jgi:hypothetical protein
MQSPRSCSCRRFRSLICQPFLTTCSAPHLMCVDRMPWVQNGCCENCRQFQATVHTTHSLAPGPVLRRHIEDDTVVLTAKALAFVVGIAQMDPAPAAWAVFGEGDVLSVLEGPHDLDVITRSPLPPERLHLVSGDPQLHRSALGKVFLVPSEGVGVHCESRRIRLRDGGDSASLNSERDVHPQVCEQLNDGSVFGLHGNLLRPAVTHLGWT